MKELPVLWKTREEMLSILPADSVGVEVGVWEGDFSAKILALAGPSCLWLVDPWIPLDYSGNFSKVPRPRHEAAFRKVAARFQAEIKAGRIRLVRAASPDAAAGFRRAQLDWVYLDGDHTFEGVSADLEVWWPKLKPNGLMMGHDYLDHLLSTTRVKSAVTAWLARQEKAVPIGQTSEMPRLPGLPQPPPNSPFGTRSFVIQKEE